MMTNQARARYAELAGVVSVTEEWTVARHKERTEGIIRSLPDEVPFLLDAGTGMYLNAIVLDVPLAPKVPPEVRAEAEKIAAEAANPRREARRLELGLAGAPGRESIWEGSPRYDAAFLYLRPGRDLLDHNIRIRSSRIARAGVEEAQSLLESGIVPNSSVREAIGVKEMILQASGDIAADEAEEKISTRTRRLARRQIRWFDKLARSLPNTSPVLVVENVADPKITHLMHVIMSL